MKNEKEEEEDEDEDEDEEIFLLSVKQTSFSSLLLFLLFNWIFFASFSSNKLREKTTTKSLLGNLARSHKSMSVGRRKRVIKMKGY